VRGYRGDLGVAVTDGDRRIFLVYHHRADDPAPIEGTAERNAIPEGAFPYSSGTFGDSRTFKLNDKEVVVSAKERPNP
jgi:hypothetical protein